LSQRGFSLRHDSFRKIAGHRADGCHEAAAVLMDTYLAAEADGYLGLFTSNVDRLVARLAWATRSPAQRSAYPMWSLDTWPEKFFEAVVRDWVVSSVVPGVRAPSRPNPRPNRCTRVVERGGCEAKWARLHVMLVPCTCLPSIALSLSLSSMGSEKTNAIE